MLKRVADGCSYAIYDQFSNLELVFLHAHGDALRVWTMPVSYEGVYNVISVDVHTQTHTRFSSGAHGLQRDTYQLTRHSLDLHHYQKE